jgi:hypothetical protein
MTHFIVSRLNDGQTLFKGANEVLHALRILIWVKLGIKDLHVMPSNRYEFVKTFP